MTLDNRIETVRAAIIQKMEGRSYLRPAGLVTSLADAIGEDPISVRQALARLSKAGWLSGVATDGTPFGQVRIQGQIPAKPIDPAQIQWSEAMRQASFTDNEIHALIECWKALDGFGYEHMATVAKGLLLLKQEQTEIYGMPSYLISARYLLGSSKLLAGLSSRALKAFGIDPGYFPKHPLYVVVGGATNPLATVLIENPAAFELALKTTAAQHCAFISTYGFGLDKASDEYGKQLAGIVEDGFEHAVTLVREGFSCPPTKQLLTAKNLYFWGDLDMAGMQIFERIAAKVPHVQLSALYGPMIEAIQDPERRHPYAAATGKPRQTLSRSSRQDVQKILPYCERYAVDQEIVLPGDIELLAGQALDVSALMAASPRLRFHSGNTDTL